MKEENIDAIVQEATVLYAIYRKDLRTKTLNGDKFIDVKKREASGRATSRQEAESSLDGLHIIVACVLCRERTRQDDEEASKTIDDLPDGDRFPLLFLLYKVGRFTNQLSEVFDDC
jgi:hypothetical protein